MRVRALSLAALAASAAASTTAAAQNVAFGKPVTANGVFGVLRDGSQWAPTATPPADPSTLTDGSFLPEATLWTSGTIWWDAFLPRSENNSLIVDLGSVLRLDRVRLQADDNDTYLVDFRTGTSGPWSSLLTFDPLGSYGMVTRPEQSLGVVEARQVRVRGSNGASGQAGDSYYSVSELEVFASTVPEPGPFALVAGGVALAGAVVRRRARQTSA